MATATGGADAFHWWQAIPWILAVASLIFSIFNLVYTNRIAKRLRRDGVVREAFNSTIRAPIESGIIEVSSELAKLKSIGRSYHGLPDLKAAVARQAEIIVERSDRLFEALAAADRVGWATGADWAALAEPHWDTFLERTNATADAPTRDQLVVAVDAAVSSINSLVRTLKLRIEQELQRHIENQ